MTELGEIKNAISGNHYPALMSGHKQKQEQNYGGDNGGGTMMVV